MIPESISESANGDISTVGDNSQPPLLTHGFAARVRARAKEKGLTQADLHRATGISRQALSDYFKGGKVVGTEGLFALADALEVDPRWLIHGGRQKRSTEPLTTNFDQLIAGELVEVAEIDPSFGMGAVFMDEAPAPEMRAFSRTWLRALTSTAPEELYWARGRGNSMAPTIDEGEPVLIDRRQQSPREPDLIWAFAWGDIGAIKRLRPMPDGSVKILSDNPAVPPDVAHGSEIHIFGRVVAVVKKL